MTLHSILQYYVLFGCIIVIDIKLKVYCCLLEAAKEGGGRGLHTLSLSLTHTHTQTNTRTTKI